MSGFSRELLALVDSLFATKDASTGNAIRIKPGKSECNSGNLFLELGTLEGGVSTLGTFADLRGRGKGNPVAAAVALQGAGAGDFT